MQLDLFNRVQTIPEEKISWSFSKIGTLRQCPRKYYYQYYGSKKRLAVDEPNKKSLMFLANLSNRYLLAGSIIHTVVATYLKKRSQGNKWDLKRLIGWANKLLSEAIEFTENHRDGIEDIRQYPPEILKEVYYSEVDTQQLITDLKEKVEINLTNFIQSENFLDLKDKASQPAAMVERKAVFNLDETVRVDGQIDVAFNDINEFVIADWKTGKVEYQDTSLQLLAYAMWAINKERASIEQIKIQKAYLQEDKIEDLEFSENHLFRARTRIIQDGELIRQLHEFGKDGISEAFTKCDQDKICSSCSFQKVCQN